MVIGWQGLVDFLVLAVAIYLLLRWSREARALRLALGIFALRVGALLAGQLDLLITSWVLDAATIIALLALVVVFQPELRRALMRLDVVGRAAERARMPVASAVAEAAFALARARCGALIVIAQRDTLSELIAAGVPLGGQVSADILEAIFRKDSPVHDGAAIIRGDVITRVGAVLPLTQRVNLPPAYGTRHRAAIGLAERSDALVVVVSEERGEVTLVREADAALASDAADLRNSFGSVVAARPDARPRSAHRRASLLPLQAAALGLAALVWGVTFLFPGHSVRPRTVPIEFTNVPPGLSVTAQSEDTLQVWLRGNRFLLDAVSTEELVARCDLTGAHEGENTIRLSTDALDLPFGLAVDGLRPEALQVRLVKSGRPASGL